MYRQNYSNVRWGMPNEAFWRPPTDVYETEDRIVVLVEIAGLGAQDYEVTLNGRSLSITGERRSPEGKLAYHQMEIRHGKFRADVQLPWSLEAEGQQASYENGFLKIILPKAQTRRVRVQTAESTGKESES